MARLARMLERAGARIPVLESQTDLIWIFPGFTRVNTYSGNLKCTFEPELKTFNRIAEIGELIKIQFIKSTRQ